MSLNHIKKKISKVGVFGFDEVKFPLSVPVFELFLSGNGFLDGGELFKI